MNNDMNVTTFVNYYRILTFSLCSLFVSDQNATIQDDTIGLFSPAVRDMKIKNLKAYPFTVLKIHNFLNFNGFKILQYIW